ncbi:hypothetical protein MPSEU_000685000 [Mayamaea pseudoterrestris]|nr:hypothetical protein MPSEU_000685000 [Mayamaea pseudoterrestris]
MFRASGLCRPLAAAATNQATAVATPSTIQTRNNWQVVLRKRFDRRTGKVKFEDWDYLVMGMEEPKLLNGVTLFNRYHWETEHIKPTEMRRRLNSEKVYRRSVKRLDDLKNYIKFTQEAKAKDQEASKAMK